jgi:hypothetical protein
MRLRFFAALVAALAATPALAADVSGPLVVSAQPADDLVCGRASVIGDIMEDFAWSEHTLWHRGFVIQSIDNPRPSGHPYAEPGLVQRDYCMADSTMSNGTQFTVFYAIEHGLDFVGLGDNVDFCVLGLDPWHVHDGFCRTVR